MKTKPQPLDLEEIKIIISDIGKKKAEQLVNYFKYKLKSACKFYLRYKDNPDLLIKEHPEYEKELNNYFGSVVDDYGKKAYDNWKRDLETYAYCAVIDDYNIWLFKLAFKAGKDLS